MSPQLLFKWKNNGYEVWRYSGKTKRIQFHCFSFFLSRKVNETWYWKTGSVTSWWSLDFPRTLGTKESQTKQLLLIFTPFIYFVYFLWDDERVFEGVGRWTRNVRDSTEWDVTVNQGVKDWVTHQAPSTSIVIATRAALLKWRTDVRSGWFMSTKGNWNFDFFFFNDERSQHMQTQGSCVSCFRAQSSPQSSPPPLCQSLEWNIFHVFFLVFVIHCQLRKTEELRKQLCVT
jgi:hypothetical protein